MLEPDELLRQWPTWRKTGADKVLASPAWRMDVTFARQKDRLVVDHAEGADEIFLSVALDEVQHILGIRDSDRYSDLHLLWSKKASLDENIILALIEKECGALFVLLEHVFGHELSVVGLTDEVPKGHRVAFRTSAYAFSIDLSSEMRLTLGDLTYLDPKHDAIRSMTRSARADYASFKLEDSAVKTLEEGDVVPLGADYLASAKWNLEGFPDGELHVVAAEETALRFADFADDTLPKIEAAGSLLLVKGARTLAEGELFDLGGVPCFRLTRMHS